MRDKRSESHSETKVGCHYVPTVHYGVTSSAEGLAAARVLGARCDPMIDNAERLSMPPQFCIVVDDRETFSIANSQARKISLGAQLMVVQRARRAADGLWPSMAISGVKLRRPAQRHPQRVIQRRSVLPKLAGQRVWLPMSCEKEQFQR